MSIQSVNTSQQAWIEFMRLAKTAQLRNPTLARAAATETPVTHAESLRRKFTGSGAIAGSPTIGSSSDVQEPKRYTRTVGSRFDAYA